MLDYIVQACLSNNGDMFIRSKMTVQCLVKNFADYLMGVLALPIVIEMCRLCGGLVLFEAKSLISILLSFSLSMFTVFHALMLHIYNHVE